MPTPPDARSLPDLLAEAGWVSSLARHLAAAGDPEDLVQETWQAALRRPPSGARPLRPWLARVLRNFARQAARGERNRRRREEAQAAAAVPTPEELLARAEAQRLLGELVAALDGPPRATVVRRFYDGLTPRQIAAAAGLPGATVRWRLMEATRRLRAELDRRTRGDRDWRLVLIPPLPARL